MAVVTVDGPSGAGKGTVCRILAEKFQYPLLDSGAIYRIAALAACNENIDLSDEPALAKLASTLDIVFQIDKDSTVVLLNGTDVSKTIREEATGMAASKIAALPAVRKALLDRQRTFAESGNLVADGRDMGTVVFPSAELKIFLTASAEERARRRVLQLQEAGQTHIDETKILADIKERDERDMNRKTAPLAPAEDAVMIDSTDLSIDEVVAVVEQHLAKHS